MYTLSVRDRFMIAHSFEGAVFGPARNLHGATYVVDVRFRRAELDPDGLVVDIGRAGEALSGILSDYAYQNLDERPEFAGTNTTTEFLAHVVFQRMADRIRTGGLGENALGIERLEVVLRESDIAWASFEGPVRPGSEATPAPAAGEHRGRP